MSDEQVIKYIYDAMINTIAAKRVYIANDRHFVTSNVDRNRAK